MKLILRTLLERLLHLKPWWVFQKILKQRFVEVFGEQTDHIDILKMEEGPCSFDHHHSLSVMLACNQLKNLQLLLPLPGWLYFMSFPHFKPHALMTSSIVITLLRGCLHKSSLELFGWETTNMHAQITSDLLPPSQLKQYWGLLVQNPAKRSHPRAFIQKELVIIQLPITHLL